MLSAEQRTPPKAAQENAQKVLDWREEHGDDVNGMTDVGWRRASQLAKGEPVSEDVIKRISQFERHEKNATIAEEHKNTPWKDAGYVAWLGWGGDAAIKEWAPNLVEKMEKRNASQKPAVFYCRHMQAGTARYENETILVDTDAMKKMAASMVGCPLYVGHQDVKLENIQEEADGYVSECFYNELDGWLWAKFVAVSDNAHQKIKEGWSVSNAYVPLSTGEGGTKNNVSYKQRIENAEFTHLAIVDNPRYEDARIYTPESFKAYQEEQRNSFEPYTNSKRKKGVSFMLKLWKKTEVKNASEADENLTEVEVNGKSYPLKEVIKALEEHENRKNADEEEGKEKVNMDAEYEVNGKPMKLSSIIERFEEMESSKDEEEAENEAEEEEKAENEDETENMDEKDERESESDEEEDKQNEDDAEEGKKDMDELKNAMSKGGTPRVVEIQTSASRAHAGRAKYGSGK